ncbi:hypothetical protein B842_07110 [Corynebacterium humireducens NBRC 106098 = DSM 45392]|uniref:Uncharacterized protein n=1 Tax=Corynebacterium humireducens NBRC 106098 = DSM 45392 TaxID=1223515 RepID=A0A0B5D3A1_9CORY|nr:hypothetical protein [Corynebacterium humireducens]AJE33271.1 hypothetical protein B842_07110 [Corynebacterium humireducens NBRC 106098 = DSM 45392]
MEREPGRRTRRTVLLAAGAAGVLLVAQLLLIAYERGNPGQFPEPGRHTHVPAPTSRPVPSPAPRPSTGPLRGSAWYWELMDRSQSMYEYYRDSPASDDEVYNQAFLLLLSDRIAAFRLLADTVGTDEEHRALSRKHALGIEQLEEKYLQERPLGTDVLLRRPDGSVLEYDGSTAPGRS